MPTRSARSTRRPTPRRRVRRCRGPRPMAGPRSRADDLVTFAGGHPATLVMAAAAAPSRWGDGARRVVGTPATATRTGGSRARGDARSRRTPAPRRCARPGRHQPRRVGSRWVIRVSDALIAELVADHVLDHRVGAVDSVHVSRAVADLLRRCGGSPSRRRVRCTVRVRARRSDAQPADRGPSRHRRARRLGPRRHRPRRGRRRCAEPRPRRHPPATHRRGRATRQPRRSGRSGAR